MLFRFGNGFFNASLGRLTTHVTSFCAKTLKRFILTERSKFPVTRSLTSSFLKSQLLKDQFYLRTVYLLPSPLNMDTRFKYRPTVMAWSHEKIQQKIYRRRSSSIIPTLVKYLEPAETVLILCVLAAILDALIGKYPITLVFGERRSVTNDLPH